MNALTPELCETIAENARKVAGAYKKKCWWASYDDMFQEAWVAQAESVHRFDESWNRPIGAYLYSVAQYAVRRLVHKDSSPVSASHRTEVLIGLHRAPDGVSENITENNPTPDACAVMCERVGRVRARVVDMVGESGAQFAFAVISDEWTPREVAAANNVAVTEIYAAQRRMTATLSRDQELLHLWKESDV